MTLDLDRPCPHAEFWADVRVARIVANGEDESANTPAIAFHADITVKCVSCGERFRWIGVPAGDRPDRPMCSVDEFELRAPIRPASSDPDFGLGIPGFSVTWREQP